MLRSTIASFNSRAFSYSCTVQEITNYNDWMNYSNGNNSVEIIFVFAELTLLALDTKNMSWQEFVDHFHFMYFAVIII